jgi:hypothetical protein
VLAERQETALFNSDEALMNRRSFPQRGSACVFPTSIDVNPQISIMSISTHRALQILSDPSRYF